VAPELVLLKEIGAKTGDILVGVKALNMDLRIRIDRDQRADENDYSRIGGGFYLVSTGTGDYAVLLSEFENRWFSNADQLIDLIKAKQEPTQNNCRYILQRDLLSVVTS
jgi:hypothetical protein